MTDQLFGQIALHSKLSLSKLKWSCNGLNYLKHNFLTSLSALNKETHNWQLYIIVLLWKAWHMVPYELQQNKPAQQKRGLDSQALFYHVRFPDIETIIWVLEVGCRKINSLGSWCCVSDNSGLENSDVLPKQVGIRNCKHLPNFMMNQLSDVTQQWQHPQKCTLYMVHLQMKGNTKYICLFLICWALNWSLSEVNDFILFSVSCLLVHVNQ